MGSCRVAESINGLMKKYEHADELPKKMKAVPNFVEP
jgi:hypothetical protein